MNLRRTRGLGAAGLLCAGLLCIGLAGCGTAVAAAAGAGAGAPPKVVAKVGCASVSQATTATVTRRQLVTEPVNGRPRTWTQRNATKVRTLFGDICAAVAHATVVHPPILCPADFGVSYAGTFYDGRRALATFVYVPGGCQRISLTAAGKTRGTLLLGKAAAAAPHLLADMAVVLGLPESQVSGSPG